MKDIYVVFLTSNYKVSAFVRRFTRYKYSHIALSETPNLEKMYSFARKYKNTPFVGGFVVELPSRYFISEKKVPVKVCALSLEDSEYDKVMARIASFKQSPEQYKYNYFSYGINSSQNFRECRYPVNGHSCSALRPRSTN